jgi:DNA-binding CsgD family transcriptional regulator
MQRACALAAPWSARAIYPWAQGELAYWASKVLPQELPVEQVTGPWALLLQGDAGAAAECWRDSARPYERAIALATGSAARRREALDEFDRLGAIPMASRLRRELRAAGIRVLPRGPRAATRANPWSLTGREIQILRLLDLSLRDAQIAQRLHLSVKTVSHHVSSILAKLEAHSRLEAVALARVRGVLGAAATPAAEKARAGRSAN